MTPPSLVLALVATLSAHATIVVLPTNGTSAVVYADRPAAFGAALPPVNHSVGIPPPYVLPPNFKSADLGLIGILWPADHLALVDNQRPDSSSIGLMPHSADRQKGCSPVIPPDIKVPWIALVERGGCAFIDKVRAMQHSGAAAVVVGDDTPSGQLVTMYSSLPAADVTIASVFIARLEYRDLYLQALTALSERRKQRASVAKHLYILIVPTPVSSFSVLDIVILSVIAPIVLVIFVYAVYHLRRYRQRGQRFMHPTGNNSPRDATSIQPLSRADLDVLAPTCTTIPLDSFGAYECPVCLDALQEDDNNHESITLNVLRVIQACRHVFHATCLEKWLLHEFTPQMHYAMCPVCKHELRPLEPRCQEPVIQQQPLEEEVVEVESSIQLPSNATDDVAIPLLVTTASPDDSIDILESRQPWWRRLLGFHE